MTRIKCNDLLLAGGFFLLVAVLLFHDVLGGGVLFTTDDSIGPLAIRKAGLPDKFFSAWSDYLLFGVGSYQLMTWTYLWLWLLPLEFFTNWIHAIDLWFASMFLLVFLRRKGLSLPACLIAGLTAFWLGQNFTLTYAGHIGKFGVLVFASMFLVLADKAVESRKLPWAVLAGGALGGMFLEQSDVALFCALFLGPYAVYQCWKYYQKDWMQYVRIVCPMVAVGVLIASHSLLSGYNVAVKGVSVQNEKSPKEKWEFTTQWSWPPEESIDFIAPGFMGWRSGEPKGPYWGRMGRSAGWEQSRQGFQNFKLENHYMGLIPVFLALLAGALAFTSGKNKALWGGENTLDRRDALFWMAVTSIALLLSFGKYFPLYRIIYQFPMISSIRNPNKFLHIFQMALGILSAYGLDLLLRSAKPSDAEGGVQ